MYIRVVFVLLLIMAAEMTSARHVVKRSDDAHPLEAVVSTHSQELSRLEARLQAVENSAGKRAAFQAPLSTAVVANAPVRFDNGFTIGAGGYDAHTGIYTVPFPGVYTFQYQLFPPDLASYVIDLYVNGNISRRSRCYDSSLYITSCFASAVLHVKAGDKVWVQSDYPGAFYTGPHSFFAGVLLSPDP
ncbi:complement C1q-like protein 4 isoform X2 [Littorina saxatilis]|uniref:C1q domain-containing protein n=1 Tax=Littorina saxatilis TaxID=31220 RepID=A0AAN9GQG1_9CAEN